MRRHARSQRLRENGIEIRGSRLGLDGNVVSLFRFHDLIVEKVERSLVPRDNSSLEPKLQLGFSGTIELLVDGGVGTVEGNVCTGTVAVALETEFDVLWDGKENA